MQKIIKNRPQPTDVVSISEINPSKFFGAERDDGYRGLITRPKYNDGPYIILSSVAFSNGNQWVGWRATNLRMFMEELINAKWVPYQFDSLTALVAWVQEGRL